MTLADTEGPKQIAELAKVVKKEFGNEKGDV